MAAFYLNHDNTHQPNWKSVQIKYSSYLLFCGIDIQSLETLRAGGGSPACSRIQTAGIGVRTQSLSVGSTTP